MKRPAVRGWRRWRRWLLMLAAAAVAGRILLALLLPWLIDVGAGFVGLTATCRSVSLSLLSLSVRVQGLELRDVRSGALLASAQDVSADVAAWQLLGGDLVVVDAELAGCAVELQRTADGALVLPPELAGGGAPAAAPPPAPEPEPAAAPDGSPFVLPFSVLRARVHGLRVRLSEAGPTPRTTDLVLDVDVADLGHRERPCVFDLRAHSPQLGERLQVTAQAMPATEDHFAASMHVTARGIATDLAAPGSSSRADLDLGAEFRAQRDAARPGPFRFTASLHTRLHLDGRERLAVQGGFGPSAPTANGFDAPFAVAIGAPGVAERVEFADGRVAHSARGTEIGVTLRCIGVTLADLRPWLAERGIAVADSGLEAHAKLHATLPPVLDGAFAARCESVWLGSGEERLELASLAIDGVRARSTQTEVGSITADGPVLAVQRLADGSIGVAGLRWRASGSPPQQAPPPEPGPRPAASQPIAVLLKKLDWRGTRLSFTDQGLPEPSTLEVQEITLAGNDLGFAGGQARGQLVATLRADGAVESARADLRIAPEAGTTHADLQVEVTGIQGKALAPWRQVLGIESTVQDGRLSLAAQAQVGLQGPATVDAHVADLRFEAGGEVLMSLRRAEVAGLSLAPNRLDLGTLRIDEPVLSLQTDADDVRSVCGVRLLRPPWAQTTTTAAAAKVPTPAAAPATSLAVTLGGLQLAGATLRCRDRRDGDNTVSVGLDASVSAWRGDGSPTTFTAKVRLEQALEALDLQGQVTPGEGTTQITTTVAGRGIRGAQLAPLLPATMSSPLVDGALRAKLDVMLREVPGGQAVDATLSGLALTDGATELVAIDEFALRAPEVGSKRVHVAELRLRGVRTLAAQTEKGLQVPGLLLLTASPATAAPAEKAAPAAPLAPAVAAGAPWPELRLDVLDIACERLEYRDRRSDDAEPLVASLRVQLEQPWATAAELTQTAPALLKVEVAAPPICRQLTVGAKLEPFCFEPRLELTVLAEGIDTTAIARVAPSSKAQLGGTTADATLTAKVHAELDLHRRDVRRFDFSRPFGGRLLVEDAAMRTADGATLLAVDVLDVGARAIDPRRGDVLLSYVEVDAPELSARRTTEGVHVAGLVVPLPAAAPPANGPPPARPPGPVPEFAVDRLRVQGLALDVRDETTSPATHLPLQDVDLEVTRLSTRMLTEPKSITFDLRARGGDVQLQRRIARSSVFAGILGSAGQAVAGSFEHEIEPRPLVDEVALAGELQYFPLPKGHLRATVSAFELPAVRGLARQGQVEIGDGLFDANIDVQAYGAGGTKVRSNMVFTWLQVSEPPGGPITTYLRLPASLDTVLFLLRNEADEQRLAVQMHVPASGAPFSTIAEAAVEALALAIGEAVGRSPIRILRTLTDTFGLGGRDEIAPAVLRCTPGATQPDLADLSRVLDEVGDDPAYRFVLSHELGAADLEQATRLANPPEASVRNSIAFLQKRQQELDLARPALAAETAAAYAAGHIQEALVRHRELRALDTRIGELQATLVEAVAMLDATSPRATARRSRHAAAAIGDARLDAVRDTLIERLGPDAARRIEIRRARGAAASGVADGGAVIVTVRQ